MDKRKEIVNLKTIAERLGYSVKYMQSNWPQLLTGVKPVSLGPNRAIRFYWDEIEKLLNQPK